MDVIATLATLSVPTLSHCPQLSIMRYIFPQLFNGILFVPGPQVFVKPQAKGSRGLANVRSSASIGNLSSKGWKRVQVS